MKSLAVDTIRLREAERYQDYERYEQARIYANEVTACAEAIDAPLECKLEYHLGVDGELYSQEGVGLRTVFEDAERHYRQLALQRPQYAFQHRRSIAELAEYARMRDMAHGRAGYNTLVVTSTYPEELRGETQDHLGYQWRRKLGFDRVIVARAGRITMWTQSFDRNHYRGIDAKYRMLGRSVDFGRDVLEQPVALTLENCDAEVLGRQLQRAYDMVCEEDFGGAFTAGRNGADVRESVAFVAAQTDIMQQLVQDVMALGERSPQADDARYDAIVALRRRYEGRQPTGNATDVRTEMSHAGAAARSAGESVSYCGVTTGSSESTQVGLSEAGYGAGILATTTQSELALLRPGKRRHFECMQCPRCLAFGVDAEKSKKGNAIYYTCASPAGCRVTTRPQPERQSAQNDHATKALGRWGLWGARRKSTTRSKGTAALLPHLVRKQKIVLGGTKEILIDIKTGEEVRLG